MADGTIALRGLTGELALGSCRVCDREVMAAALSPSGRCLACAGLHRAKLVRRDPWPVVIEAEAPPRRAALDPDPIIVRGSVSWARASSATGLGDSRTQALPEVLESPAGARLTRAVLALELAAAIEAEVVRRGAAYDAGADPGPIPAALEQLALALEAHPITAPAGAEETTMPEPKIIDGKTFKQWATELGVTDSAVRQRVKAGRNPDGTERASVLPDTAPKPRPKLKRVATPKTTDTQASDVEALLKLTGIEHRVLARTSAGLTFFVPASA